jgi:hypothetical protein
MRLLLLILPLFAALAACEAKKPDWAKDGAGSALPPQVCAQTKKALDGLAKGAFDYTDQGEATLPTDVWLKMPNAQREQLANTLAYHASCAAGTAADAQSVVIRGDDGNELLRRTVSTRIDTGELLRGD